MWADYHAKPNQERHVSRETVLVFWVLWVARWKARVWRFGPLETRKRSAYRRKSKPSIGSRIILCFSSTLSVHCSWMRNTCDIREFHNDLNSWSGFTGTSGISFNSDTPGPFSTFRFSKISLHVRGYNCSLVKIKTFGEKVHSILSNQPNRSTCPCLESKDTRRTEIWWTKKKLKCRVKQGKNVEKKSTLAVKCWS